jgi:hypothetical protein
MSSHVLVLALSTFYWHNEHEKSYESLRICVHTYISLIYKSQYKPNFTNKKIQVWYEQDWNQWTRSKSVNLIEKY